MEQTYRNAVLRFKLDAGEHYQKTVKARSHFSRGGWYLLNRRGDVVAIVGEQGCLWGNRLAVYFTELAKRTA